MPPVFAARVGRVLGVGVCVGCDPYSGLTSTLLVSVNRLWLMCLCLVSAH